MKKMLVFVNFTEASMQAVKQAAALATLHGGELVLCHISKDDSDKDTKQKLSDYAVLAEESGARASILTGKGDFFGEAPSLTKRIAPDLVIIGAVGIEGFSISHFGSAIYKLVRSLSAPTLVIQSNTSLSATGYHKVMLPLSTHTHFVKVVKSLSEVMASKGVVTIFGITVNDGELDEKLISNAAAAQDEMDRLGIEWTFKKVNVSKVSSGYADLILNEMTNESMDLIAMPADVAERSQHFGKMDKEALLSNSIGYPVFCINTDL